MVELPIPDQPIYGIVAGLLLILVAVLTLPFTSKKIEENLEPFFFLMGLAGVTVIYTFGIANDSELLLLLFKTAFTTPVMVGGLPIGIFQAVLFFGLLFYYFHKPIYRLLNHLLTRLGLTLFTFLLVFVLGLISSIISVIVTAVILSEIISALKIPREAKVRLTVYAAFSVGLGAALTPVGEPLSTIATSKLDAPFFYLLDLLGAYVIPGVLAISIYASLSLRKYSSQVRGVAAVYEETLRSVVERAVRVFMFVAALELLGAAFTPLVKWYFAKMPSWGLYWMNTISAVVDNATLTAAEIGPFLTQEQIRSALMSLLISGGMLIPGNIPNIVAAGRLKITSREWARVGIPFGAVLLVAYFIVIEVLGIHVDLGLGIVERV